MTKITITMPAYATSPQIAAVRAMCQRLALHDADFGDRAYTIELGGGESLSVDGADDSHTLSAQVYRGIVSILDATAD